MPTRPTDAENRALDAATLASSALHGLQALQRLLETSFRTAADIADALAADLAAGRAPDAAIVARVSALSQSLLRGACIAADRIEELEPTNQRVQGAAEQYMRDAGGHTLH